MSVRNALASLPVADIDAAAAWYSQLLEADPTRPMDGLAEWRFDGGGALQLYELAERAGEGSVTLSVTDIDDTRAVLDRIGVSDVDDVSEPRVDTLMITDPDGNHIAFAHPNDPTLAR